MEPADLVSEFLAITNTSDVEDAKLFLQNSNQNLEVEDFEKNNNFF